MKVPRSKLGAWVIGNYLVLVLIACSPLIVDGAIHHGNGIAFLAATVLTAPLSFLMFWMLGNLFVDADQFFAAGVLFAGALTNATVIYLIISRF